MLASVSWGEAGQIAASVEYDFISPPVGLSDDFRPSEATTVKFLAIKTIDGLPMETALWQPNRKQVTETTLIVTVHGSGGSYRRAPQSVLGRRLASKGYAVLAINTRQHDEKVNTDNFLDVQRDTAVQVGRALGRAWVKQQAAAGSDLHRRAWTLDGKMNRQAQD